MLAFVSLPRLAQGDPMERGDVVGHPLVTHTRMFVQLSDLVKSMYAIIEGFLPIHTPQTANLVPLNSKAVSCPQRSDDHDSTPNDFSGSTIKDHREDIGNPRTSLLVWGKTHVLTINVPPKTQILEYWYSHDVLLNPCPPQKSHETIQVCCG